MVALWESLRSVQETSLVIVGPGILRVVSPDCSPSKAADPIFVLMVFLTLCTLAPVAAGHFSKWRAGSGSAGGAIKQN